MRKRDDDNDDGEDDLKHKTKAKPRSINMLRLPATNSNELH